MAKARWPVAVRDCGTNRSLDDHVLHVVVKIIQCICCGM